MPRHKLLVVLCVLATLSSATALLNDSTVDAITFETPTNVSSYGENRIAGGESVPISKVPFIVGIRDGGDEENHCSGVLITRRLVLTAAHCTHAPNNGARYPYLYVSIMSNDLGETDEGIQVRSVQWKLHNDYHVYQSQGKEFYTFDIAVLVLEKYFDSKYQNFPTMFTGKLVVHENKRDPDIATAYGWGITGKNEPKPGSLHKVDLILQVNKYCQSAFGKRVVYFYHLCAGTKKVMWKPKSWKKRNAACDGDAGGPLMYKDQVVGIISETPDCGEKPSLSIRISPIWDFVEHVMRKFPN